MKEIKKYIIIGGITYILGFSSPTALLLYTFYDYLPDHRKTTTYISNTIKYLNY
jgi:hypothetical protein